MNKPKSGFLSLVVKSDMILAVYTQRAKVGAVTVPHGNCSQTVKRALNKLKGRYNPLDSETKNETAIAL